MSTTGAGIWMHSNGKQLRLMGVGAQEAVPLDVEGFINSYMDKALPILKETVAHLSR